ncbi:MAG: IS1 family transposase [Bacteroidota bacterium]
MAKHHLGNTAINVRNVARYESWNMMNPDTVNKTRSVFYQHTRSEPVCEGLVGYLEYLVRHWLIGFKKKRQQPLLKSTLCVNDPLDVLELDEMWRFVHDKTNKRWIWWALSRSTRQIVAWYIGDRSTESCR